MALYSSSSRLRGKGLLAACLAAAIVVGICLWTGGALGILTAEKLEEDARASQRIDPSWQTAQTAGDQLAAMVFYPEDRADHTFSLYWNRPGPSAGWFFRAGGSITPLQEGVVRFTLEGCGEVAYGSLNRPGVSQAVVDDGSDPRVLSLDPEKPFALVLPRNAGTVTFYDREGRVVEPHQEIL